MKIHRFSTFALVAVMALLGTALRAGTPPTPTHANVSYGASPHQIMDIYVPTTGAGPFPAVIWYGSIWKAGKGVPDLNHFPGCVVVGVETRAMDDAKIDKVAIPISYVLLDARRALQFLRLHAKDYNVDPDHIATAGGSQGTLPALYVNCAGEKADPKSADPVEQVSTKVTCTGAWRSQPSIDPKVMQEWVPGVKWGSPALGPDFDTSLKNRDQLLPAIQEWSPDALINSTTQPIYFENEWGTTCPPDVKPENWTVHSPLWGLGFKKVADTKGVTVYNKYPGSPDTAPYKDMWDFLVKKLHGQ